MSYATVDQLADALEIRVTPDNTQVLQDCLDAAAAEIDQVVAAPVDAENPPAIVSRVNVNRGVEWYKAPATYNGGVGYSETGTIAAPTSGFERHAVVLNVVGRSWGVA